jgi:GAF domain-containing protein
MFRRSTPTPPPASSGILPQQTVTIEYWREVFAMNILRWSAIILTLIALFSATSAPVVPIGIQIAIILVVAFFGFFPRLKVVYRIFVLLGLLWWMGVYSLFSSGLFGATGLFFLALAATSTILYGNRGLFTSLSIITVSLVVFGLGLSSGDFKMTDSNMPVGSFGNWAIFTASLILIAFLISSGLDVFLREFKASLERTEDVFKALSKERSLLEIRVNERSSQISTMSEVGRVASSILDPDELMTQLVNLITNRLGHYYAGIYTVDELEHWAILKDGTGVVGQVLKQNKHRVEIGDPSMVSKAVSSRKAQVAMNFGEESEHVKNPIFRDTMSEISLPLIVGERAIGVLDVHSVHEAAFTEQDVDTLQGIANQIAIALENARLFQQTQKNLVEISNVHRQYLANSWTSLVRTEGSMEYTAGDEIGAGEESSQYSVPLALRDQTIGEITLASAANEEWTAEEKGWIEAVATQAALALENARLLEETQQLALHERLVAEISSKIWSSTTIQSILQTTVKELGQALNASEATIELKPMDVNK